MDIKPYLKEKKALVDSFLRSYFKKRFKPDTLRESMLYSLFAGGKRLRPILALSAYEACGGNSKDIIKYASALELIHTYSLIHDDLPSMDNDELRRGKPTNHKVYGEAMATLAGDALLTEAFCMLSEPEGKISEKSLLKALHAVSRASGIGGMVSGQAQDIISEDSKPDKKTLSFIHKNKTGALITAAIKLGGILACAERKKMEALTDYGESIGLAFQVVDDILDIKGSAEELGKKTGSDLRKKKMTYPSLYGIRSSEKKAKDLVRKAVRSLNSFSEDAEPLREMARYIIIRRN